MTPHIYYEVSLVCHSTFWIVLRVAFEFCYESTFAFVSNVVYVCLVGALNLYGEELKLLCVVNRHFVYYLFW